jgi:hypothetical protein
VVANGHRERTVRGYSTGPYKGTRAVKESRGVVKEGRGAVKESTGVVKESRVRGRTILYIYIYI